MPRVSLLLPWTLAAALLGGCATVTPPPPATCAQGNVGLCRYEATQHLSRGERAQAAEALGRGCEGGLVPDCIEAGELLLADGKLQEAEPPLQRARQEGWGAAYEPLARLHEAKGGEAELAAAHRLRWQARSVDHPDAEVTFWYRWSEGGGVGSVLALNLQPMWAHSRRVSFGVQLALNPGLSELNGFVGYQHFATDWLVPYGNVQLGRGDGAGPFLNVGAEAGVKLALGPLGHLNLAVGSSRASPFHVSVGLGLDYLLVLIAALQ